MTKISEIILVDDDDITVMLSEKLLQDYKILPKPHSFTDGLYAFDYLKLNYSLEKTYTIFLDINMPYMNAWEFLNSIKTFASAENIYVCLLSSSTDERDMRRADGIEYVRHFFSKPLTKEHLHAVSNLGLI